MECYHDFFSSNISDRVATVRNRKLNCFLVMLSIVLNHAHSQIKRRDMFMAVTMDCQSTYIILRY